MHRELKKKAKDNGYTVSQYLRTLIIENMVAGNEIKAVKVFNMIKNNPMIWKAIRASINKALAGENDGQEEKNKHNDNLNDKVAKYKEKFKGRMPPINPELSDDANARRIEIWTRDLTLEEIIANDERYNNSAN